MDVETFEAFVWGGLLLVGYIWFGFQTATGYARGMRKSGRQPTFIQIAVAYAAWPLLIVQAILLLQERAPPAPNRRVR